MDIEKGIPIPGANPQRVWPFDKLEVGDSFLIPEKMERRARNAASAYQRDHAGVKLTIRKVEGNRWRLWRVS